MRTSLASLVGTTALLLGSCSPTSDFRNFATPENAVRTLLQAAKIGDKSTSVDALVTRERVTFESNPGPVFTFSMNGELVTEFDFAIKPATFGPERKSQVEVQFDSFLTLAFPCELESDGWRVSMMGFRNGMMGEFEETLEKLEEAIQAAPLPR